MIRKDIVQPGEDYTIAGGFLSFGFQPNIREHGEFVVWYDHSRNDWFRLTTRVTGGDAPSGWDHAGTAMSHGGEFVLHAFTSPTDAKGPSSWVALGRTSHANESRL